MAQLSALPASLLLPGSAVEVENEVSGNDSLYTARVVSHHGERVKVQPDGSGQAKLVKRSFVRPLPPPTPDDFAEGLRAYDLCDCFDTKE